MADTYAIFDSTGQRREVEANSPGEARNLFREFYPDQYESGIIIRNLATGDESYTSPGYATTDPEAIRNIREQGMTAGEASRRAYQEAIVSEDPALARGAAMMSGVPGLRGWYDEAVGSLYGPEAAAGVRFAQEAMQETRPMETLGLQLGTGIATSLPFGVATTPATPMSLGRAMLQGGFMGAAGGGLEGAIAGAGMGETLDARAYNAAQQAQVGTMIGGPLGMALPAAGAGAAGAYNTFRGNPAMERIARAVGLSPEATQVAGGYRAFEQGGPDILPAPVPRSLAETSPEMSSLLDLSMSVPSAGRAETRGMLSRQATEASQRLTGELNQTLGEAVGPAIREAEMRQATMQARRDAYNAAYAAPIDYTTPQGDRLITLLDRVDPDIIQRANQLMAREGNQSNQIRVTLDENGEIVSTERLPDVMQLDYITRALQSRARAMGAEPEDVRTLTAQLVDIRGTLDELVPEYRAARSEAAQLLGNIDALEIGYNAMLPGTRRDILQMELDGLTEGEITSVRAGVRDYIDELVGRVSRPLDPEGQEAQEAVAALRALTTSNAQAKLRMILGDEADAFIERLQENIEPLAIRAVGGGSPTAPRQFGMETVRDLAQPGALERAAQNPQAIPGMLTGVLASGTPTSRETIRNMLGELGPFAARQRPADELGQLRDYLARVQAAEALPQELMRTGVRSGYQIGLGTQPAITQYLQQRGTAPAPIGILNR